MTCDMCVSLSVPLSLPLSLCLCVCVCAKSFVQLIKWSVNILDVCLMVLLLDFLFPGCGFPRSVG